MNKPLYILLPALLSPAGTYADVATDGSIGSATTLSGPFYQIGADLGKQAGSNLFHSFSRFSVGKGETALFSGPRSIKNILSRVTGGQLSAIDGQITSTIPGADLYLFNPAGIAFGPNAQLNISGSFHISTADYLRFAGDEKFFTKPVDGEILSAAAPAAFGFMDDSPAPAIFGGRGEISLDSFTGAQEGLRINKDQTFNVVSGDINFERGTYLIDDYGDKFRLGSLGTSGGQINLVAAASAGEVSITESKGIQTDGFSKLGRVNLTPNTMLETDSVQGGNIGIKAGQITMDDAEVRAFMNAEEVNGASAKVSLSANRINVKNNSELVFSSSNKSSGAQLALGGGDVKVQDSIINASSFGEGAGGSIDADVASFEFSGGKGAIFLSSNASGNAGNMRVQAKDIKLDNTLLDAGVFGSGKGSAIALKATGNIDIGNHTEVYLDSQSTEKDGGDSGHLTVEANHFTLTDSSIFSVSLGAGASGAVTVNADTVNVKNSAIEVATQNAQSYAGSGGNVSIEGKDLDFDNARLDNSTIGFGAGGSLTLQGDTIKLRNNSLIQAGANGSGRGGNVLVKGGSVEFDRATVDASAGIESAGGNVQFNVNNLSFKNNSSLNVFTVGSGAGGNLDITTGNLEMDDSFIDVGTSGSGLSGTINVDANTVAIRNGSQIAAFTDGSGDSGNIRIKANQTLRLQGVDAKGFASSIDSGTRASSGNSGNGGLVDIQTTGLMLEDGAQITSSTTSSGSGHSGKAGAVTLAVSGNATLSGVNPHGENIDGFGSGIYVRSVGAGAGDAGKVVLTGGSLTIKDGALIESSANAFGNGGDVDVRVNGTTSVSGSSSNIALQAARTSQLEFQQKNVLSGESVSGIYARSNSTSVTAGSGGNISISGGKLDMRDKGRVSTASAGGGSAGSIQIAVQKLALHDKALISSQSNAQVQGGQAGRITVSAANGAKITSGSALTTEAVSAGGGQITFASDAPLELRNGNITTSVRDGRGNGGDLNVSSEFIVMQNGKIIARAFEGNGGNINITTTGIYRFPPAGANPIDASSQLGVDGIVAINSPDVDTSANLTVLPADYLDATQWAQQPCAARAANTSSFVVKQREGVPIPRDDWLGYTASPPGGGGGTSSGATQNSGGMKYTAKAYPRKSCRGEKS